MKLLSIVLQAAPAGGATGGGGSMMSILMIVLLFVIMYFFMIRPQQKKQKEVQKMREALKVGDRVIVAGGIYGKLKDIDTTTNVFTVEIAEGVRIKVDKASVFATNDEATATR
ncbi:MAG: preprotein translocase subunit YajC [Dysgonamonadaceae bacterium]|jgi:preprotein translocase subunit YajC|nr:preprotein translocase subunit YajC [Dysgonamonadaceae bacterium]